MENGLRWERPGPSRPGREVRKRTGLKPYPNMEHVTGADRARARQAESPRVGHTAPAIGRPAPARRQPRAELMGAAGRLLAGAGGRRRPNFPRNRWLERTNRKGGFE